MPHHHGHQHHHHQHDSSKSIAVAFFLNFSFAIVEFIGGILTGSVAIQSDAIHDFGDALSIAFAYVMEKLSARGSTTIYSYGLRRFSLVSAFVNAVILIIGSIYILNKAIPRLYNPVEPQVPGMIGLAILGVAVNAYAAWRVSKGRTMNERVISWHLVEDVLGWVAVLVASLVMLVVDAPIIDPLLSISITAYILWNVFKSMKSTIKLFLQAVPEDFDLQGIRSRLLALDGIKGIHDMHVWSLDGERHVLTLHAVVAENSEIGHYEVVKKKIRDVVSAAGNIHVTVEIERENEVCLTQNCVPF